MPDAVAALTALIVETFRLNGRLLAVGDALVAEIGLTSARWQVLGAVAMSPAPLPVAHIARNMGMSRQAVQRLVDAMRRDGLLRLADNPHHRRAKLVLLTGAGRSAYTEAMKRQRPWARALAGGLGVGRIEAASATLAALRSRLEPPASGE